MSSVRRGREWEWEVRKVYESLGYLVTRSAASQGKYDLIAINHQSKHIILIQCKYGTHKYIQRAKKEMENKNLGNYEVEEQMHVKEAFPNSLRRI